MITENNEQHQHEAQREISPKFLHSKIEINGI